MKLGVKNLDDLAELGITNLDDLSRIGIKNADDLSRLGIKNADEVFDGLKGASGAKKTLSSIDAEEYAFNAIKGSDKADNVVLGKYEKGSAASYDAVAKDMDAQYFNLDNWSELDAKYSSDEIWKINEKFLDIQNSSGREIYLSHNPAEHIGKGTYYSREIQYLADNGYKFVKEGDLWHAIR